MIPSLLPADVNAIQPVTPFGYVQLAGARRTFDLTFQKKGAAPISECGPVEIPLPCLAVLCHDIRSRADSVCNDYVINHTQIARVYVINTHASAGFDRRLNDFTRFVHNVTRPVENITARIIRAVLANNERLDRLITGGGAFLSCRGDDRSRYRYWFCSSWPVPFTFRTRLGKCQRRNQHAGESDNCFLHYDGSLLMLMEWFHTS